MIKLFEEKKFNIPKLKGISEKTIKEHLKLYAGYVKHLNLIHEIIENSENPEYARREAYRRQGFEFDGMRNHEYYFSHFEGGPSPLSTNSPLSQKIVESANSHEVFLGAFTNLALTRGVGWAMLGYDKHTNKLIQYWIDEHQIGILTGVAPILALDMWEHAYFTDYTPGEKKKYIEAFFANLNWQNVEENFADAV